MKSYLTPNNDDEIKDYTRKTSYFPLHSRASFASALYSSLPEEYDIFSQIAPSFFTNRETKQQELISDCLIYMRKTLLSLYESSGVVCVLPKLYASSDDGSITFNWAYSTFRAFLSFENETGGYDAYCGIVFKSDIESVATKIRKISSTNYKNVLDELLELVINNS